MPALNRLTRDAWLAIGLLVVLLLLSAASLWQQSAPPEPPAAASSGSGSAGLRALRLWLDELGYDIGPAQLSRYDIPAGTDVVLMLATAQAVTGAEWPILDRWIEDGGTLILAGAGASDLDHFGFASTYTYERLVTSQTPLFNSPPLAEMPTLPPEGLRSDRDDFVTHLARGDIPVLISFTQGEGRVIISASSFPFTNYGLQQPGNPSLVLNILNGASPIGDVWFDEWHNGVWLAADTTASTGPATWLRQSPTGWALIYCTIVLFIALWLHGRNFGRPLPLPRQLKRRGPLEYVTASANLRRRAGQRDAVLRDYHDRLKRALGARYRLDPRLPDEEFIAGYVAMNRGVDENELRRLLARLAQSGVDEAEMVQAAAQAADWSHK